MLKPMFIPDEEIARAFSAQMEGEPPPPPVEQNLPWAPRIDITAHGIGTFGGYIEDGFVTTYAAMGFAVDWGTLDCAEIRHAPPLVRPYPGFRFPEPRDVFLAGDHLIPRARQIYGTEWATLMRGNPVGERTLRGHGGQGVRPVAQAAFVAEQSKVERWLAGPLVERAKEKPAGDGWDRWRPRDREQVRMIDVTCIADAGAVGSAMGLPAVAIKRLKAAELRLELEPYLVVLGGRVFGRGTPAQVHDRIPLNEYCFWTEVEEAMVNGRVTIGTQVVDLDEPLLPPGNILLFDADLADPETGTISEEARMAYAAEVGLTVALAIATGALHRVADLEANDDGGRTNRFVRTLRLVGHRIDRAELAETLARARASRLRARLLETLRGTSGPGQEAS
jgi:hypothetical protein